MTENVCKFIQASFVLRNAEEVEPDEDEIRAFEAYHAGDPEYQPVITHEELLKEMGI